VKEKQTISRPPTGPQVNLKNIATALSLFCIVSFSAIGSVALAQTEPSSPAINSGSEQNKEQNKEKQKPKTKSKVRTPEKKNSQKKDNKAATDTFKPSEEISEDLPVSFPVDI